MENLDRLWKKVLDDTKSTLIEANKIDEAQFVDYFETSKLHSLKDNNAIVVVPAQFNVMVITQPAFLTVLENKLKEISETEYRIRVITEQQRQERESQKKVVEEVVEFNNNLIKEFTFDTFVVGASNRIAAAAANSVATTPGNPATNPLFIFGNSGLGKTHLLNAVGNKILEYKPNAKIYYTTINGYMNDYVDALNRGTIADFNNKYNSLDLLLIDDIQFLEGKDKTSEEFFHLFNNLVNNNKQIVITSDRLPQELVNLQQRLISRFVSGLQVGIDVPEFETSLAILKKKMQLQHIDENMIDEEVLNYMANNYGKDIRELEGKLRRIMFDSVLFKKEVIDMDFVLNNSFKDDVVRHPTETVTANTIIKCVAKYYNLTTTQILGKNRTATVALARSIAMYLIKKDIDMTFQEIGKQFGGKNHATVLKACQKVEKNMQIDDNYKVAIKEIREKYK